MLIKKFINQFGVKDLLEIDKVLYLAFFHRQHSNTISFSKDDVKEWFSALDWSEPNTTRLWDKLKNDRRFIRGKDNVYKIHGNSFEDLEDTLKNFNYEETYLKLSTPTGNYINSNRLNDLKNIKSDQYDLSKIIEICEELNKCMKQDCFLAIGALVRVLIDHVPPVFGVSNFKEVCSTYAGNRSFKEAMNNLDKTSRKISDNIIHSQIRRREVLPNNTQVDFSNDVDLLLSEVIRILS